MIQSFVYWCAYLEDILLNSYENFHFLETYLRTHIANTTNHNYILVGHSLGGAIAKIVAVKLNLTGIAFEAPGLTYGARKFKLDSDVLRKNVVNVVATNDVVPKIDKQSGLTQVIKCPSQNPLTCHSLHVVLCELFTHCNASFGTNTLSPSFCT